MIFHNRTGRRTPQILQIRSPEIRLKSHRMRHTTSTHSSSRAWPILIPPIADTMSLRHMSIYDSITDTINHKVTWMALFLRWRRIRSLQRESERLKAIDKTLPNAPYDEVSLPDPEAHPMRHGGLDRYIGQSGGATEAHIIVQEFTRKGFGRDQSNRTTVLLPLPGTWLDAAIIRCPTGAVIKSEYQP